MPISQKPKDVLHNVDVPIKCLTFLSNDIEKKKNNNVSKVSKQAMLNNVSLSKNLPNLKTCTKCWQKTELGITKFYGRPLSHPGDITLPIFVDISTEWDMTFFLP